MLLSVKRDPLLPTSSKSWKITGPWSTPSSLPPQLPRLLHCNSWLLTQDVLSENSSEITENIVSLSMMIYPSKPSLTDKCLYFWEDHQAERLIQEMSSIFIPVFWKELLRWTWLTVVAHWLLSQSLKHKLVMCLPIFPPMLSQLLMDKFSWKLSFSIRVSDQLLMSVFLCPESDQLPRLRLWNKSLVLSSSNLPNTERSLPSPNSVQILMLPPNIFLTEERNWLSSLSKSNMYQWLLKNKSVFYMLELEDT